MAAFGEVASNQALDRTLTFFGENFRKGVTAPTDVTIGTTPTIAAIQFAATNELASVFVAWPIDMDRTVDVDLILVCSLAAVETNGDTLDFTMDYTAPVALATGSGVAKTSTQITAQTTVTTANGLAIGDIYTITFTLAAADATNPLASSIGVAMEIHLTNTTGVGTIDIVGADLTYRAQY